MKSDKRWLTWRKTVAIIALTAPAIVGVGGAANAAVPAHAGATANATASVSAPVAGSTTMTSASPATTLAASGTSSAEVAPDRAGGPASARVSVATVVSAIKKIPGLWATFSAAVKKAYAAFTPLWNGIKAVLGGIGTLVSALDIWNYFH
ncbi:hypothetical protein AX769_11430 [Frondihabitans sp. PAMC 28766]|uniref:hypothetical protein n=1 Tax=Frondihabitans sp. PAMC 28766 TaxID=1795630 RepID=UPI00078E4B5C|nr:hypothetical protein [Frondihabitans sp. PAMC 28766]AMM20643.1 hypothetical protein AX769_11430 [Frondihabitans sp. PAMC 28766]